MQELYWLIFGFYLWLIVYTNQCYKNGSFDIEGHDYLSAFHRDLARKIKGEYIKTLMGKTENGSFRCWNYKDIREKNLYEVVGNAILPGFGHFFRMHIMLPFGPLSLHLAIKVVDLLS